MQSFRKEKILKKKIVNEAENMEFSKMLVFSKIQIQNLSSPKQNVYWMAIVTLLSTID